MAITLLIHLLVGTALIGANSRVKPSMAWIGALAPASALVWLSTQRSTIFSGPDEYGAATQRVEWVGQLGLGFDLRLDGFTALMVLLVAGVGVLVFAYSANYFSATTPNLGRLLGLLVLFAGSMLGLVFADNLLVLYGFWELTSVTSFLLIGNRHVLPEARAAAIHAFLVTGLGALVMLGGFILLGQSAGTYRISEILSSPPTGALVGPAVALILVGIFTKSAQVPFHAWLPGAMVAPTPISAYLHSATMVKAGVYLLARLAPAFAGSIGWWRPVVVGVGIATLIHGGTRALRHHDLKLLLAHGTISQLGLMVALFGLATPEASAAGAVVLLAHGAFKAAAFMVVGVVDHQYGTRDLRCLPRPDQSWAVVSAVTVIAGLSMAGLPPMLGFVSKEAALEAFHHEGGPNTWLVLALIAVGSAFTVAYSIRFVWGYFGLGATEPVGMSPRSAKPSPWFVAPSALLSVLTVVIGLAPQLLDSLDSAAEFALHPRPQGVHLSLWHGFNTALKLTIVAAAGGIVLFTFRNRVRTVLSAGRSLPDSGDVYVGAIRGLNKVADTVTGRLQTGSLPWYSGVVLATASIVPLWALSTGAVEFERPETIESPAHIAVAAVLIGASLGACAVRRRFSAALFLGVVGYSMAALFVVQGAPDLALTQVAIETLTTVLFVLVLRRLPDRFGWSGDLDSGEAATSSPMNRHQRAIRLAVAALVGISVFVLALAVSNGPPVPTTVSDEMVERALPDGHGHNVVNVILVDIRGFDTLGELTVLICASIGTVALARAGRRPVSDGSRRRGFTTPSGAVSQGGPTPLPAQPRLPRMITLDVSVRLVFALVMVTSVYLLFTGHSQPGGGFVGGIVAGAAVALRYISGGIESVRSLSRGRPWIVMGTGLLISVVTALIPLAVGGAVLQSDYLSMHLPLLGYVKVTSAAVFDLGVYIAVLGLALMVFESFGDDSPATPASGHASLPHQGAGQ